VVTLLTIYLNRAATSAISLAQTVACACSNTMSRTAETCGPFGNPPARLIRASKPECGIGELLGPWQDADGTDRYACRYVPAAAQACNKLPLYLHGSMFGAGRVRLTPRVELRDTAMLSGDARTPSYILLAPEGQH